MNLKHWISVGLINFLVAACLGVVLRVVYLTGLSHFKYQNLLHAHSHLAMLGWVYPALLAFCVSAFIPKSVSDGKYTRFLIGLQLAVAGILFSFPFQGYGPVSIGFTAAHVVISILLSLRVLQVLRDQPRSLALGILRWGLFFQIFSTLGILLLPVVILSIGKQNEWYVTAIQFYLHFQINGWFVFGALAILFKKMEGHRAPDWDRRQKAVLMALIVATFLSFGTVIYWAFPSAGVRLVNSLGQILQALAFSGLFYLKRKELKAYLNRLSKSVRFFLKAGLLALGFKVFFQLLLFIPGIIEMCLEVRHFPIAFLHLIMLGFTSITLFSLIISSYTVNWQRSISGLFLTGFVATELILFVQAWMLYTERGFMPGFHLILSVAAVLLALSVLLVLLARLNPLRPFSHSFNQLANSHIHN